MFKGRWEVHIASRARKRRELWINYLNFHINNLQFSTHKFSSQQIAYSFARRFKFCMIVELQ